MGFRDMFQKKLQQEQVQAAADVEEKQAHLVERTGLLAEVEPKLKSLVIEVFEVLEEAGIPPIPVWPMSPYIPNHLAFALSPLTSVGKAMPSPIAAVVIDCQGMMAFRHPVTTSGEWPNRIAISTTRLDDAFEQILRGVVRSDAPRSDGIYITEAGELMLSMDAGGPDRVLYTSEPLEEFLACHAAKTIARP